MAAMKRAVRVLLLLLLVALPATAMAAPKRDRDKRPFDVEKSRGLYNAKALPKQAGGVAVSPAEGVASYTQTVTLTLTDPGNGPVELALPARFGERARNGRAYVPGTPTGTRRLGASGRSVKFDVSGLPAGTYALPVSRGGRKIATVRFRLYAPRREGAEEEGEQEGSARAAFGRLGRVPIDASEGLGEESESFVALSPLDPQRVVAYGNDIGGSGDGGVHVSNDGGATWAHPEFPHSYSTPNGTDTEIPGGDPILAADDLGNVWAGGLSLCSSPAQQGRLFVNRIAAGTSSFQPKNAGLPFLHTGNSCGDLSDVIQDKPQMTIDGTPTSPTYGRLYVTWDDPNTNGSVNEAITFCDTRPNGYPDPAHCDTGANWSTPAVISDSGGSYITSDVAVGPDGKVYVVWWDFSNANEISADMCDAAAHSCADSAGWGADKTIANLSVRSGNKIVPFQCNTLAQPGGRAAPVPSIAVDHSGSSNNGRIYVSWSDLDTSGTTRCSDSAWFTPGSLTQDTFDSFVASAPDFATLTSGTPASATRGTSIITDTGDHWFPWVAVDQSSGQAHVDLYSTRDDATRTTTQFYTRSVTPGSGTPVTFGTLTKVSTDSSTFADRECCNFGNDYGDYTGLAAAQGVVAAVWTHRHLVADDANVEVDLPASPGAHLTADAPTLAEGPGSDGDGKLDPGEQFTLTVPLRNNGPGSLDNVSATATPMSPGVSLSSASSSYGASIGAGSASPNETAFTGTLGSAVPCGVNIDFRLAVTTDQGPRAVQVAPSNLVCGAAPPPPPPPPTTDTTPTPPPTTNTTPTPPPGVDRTPPRLKVTFAKRADRRGRYAIKLAAAGEAAAGRATLRLAKGRKRRLASRLIATSGTKSLKLVLKLKRKDLRLLRRKHRLRVTLTVSLTDLAGNTANGRKTFTLRLKR